MADWNVLDIDEDFVDVIDEIKSRDVDAGTLFVSAPTNPPTGAFRYLRASNKFQEWSGAAWVDVILSIAGGGSGSATAADARTAFGLGSMAVQNSGAVNITGGSVAASLTGSTSIPAAGLTGTITQARLGTGSGGAGTKVLYDDQTYKVIPVTFPIVSAVKVAGFTVDFTSDVYPCNGTFIVTLPTVVGNGGKRVCIVNRGTGVLTILCNGTEKVLGVSSYTFDWGQYGSLLLSADANSGLWDVI